MKKLFMKLGLVFTLVLSSLFGNFANITPVLADEATPLPDELVDVILGLDTENPSNNPTETLPDDVIQDILDAGNGEYIPEDPDSPLPDDVIDDIINSGNIVYNPDEPLPDDVIDDIINPDDTSDETDTDSTFTNTCQEQSEGVSWILCSAFGLVTKASDTIYNHIEGLLVVEPLTTESDSAIYRVWDYMRGFTNIIFVIFLIIVIYSQITGLGINNYGIKRILPRLIIAVILVNLSYIICALLVDASNIIGSGITGIFNKILTDTGLNDPTNALLAVDWNQIYLALTAGGSALALFTVGAGGLGAAFWTAIILAIGVVFSVISGLITIGLRQVVVTLLVAISPLAFVAYLLPNTEKWFDKWKTLLAQMIFFYPIFALLFNASKLAGLTIIGSSGGDLLKVIVGLAVQILPLFLSVSLLKMSGTILGKVSSGLDKAFGRAATPLQGWADSHRALSASNHLTNKYLPSSHLRRFLLKNRLSRDLHTETNLNIAKNQALTKVLNKDMGFKGFDKNGNPIYRANSVISRHGASKYMQAAKNAKLQADRAATAQRNYDNTLSEFDRIYKGRNVSRLSYNHAQTYLNMKSEIYRAENIAESDQSFVLNNFIAANKARARGNSALYNRLVGRADGGLGDTGKDSIMGQVVQENANIETRRRREAQIMYNKFNYSKADVRSAMLDMASVNDDGYELGPDGKPVEDWLYRLKPGAKHRHCEKYVAVNKDTNVRISKEDYLKLSPQEQKHYKRVNYFDVYDDDGDTMTRVFMDDAAYIKEMLNLDIAIGDPINRRYLTEIGNPRFKSKVTPLTAPYMNDEKAGVLRRYHSTISAALRSSGYNEHDASITAMILAQANSGFITDVTQRNIAMVDSILKATKPGKFLQNDAIIMDQLAKIINSAYSETVNETFQDVFADSGVARYRNVNEACLKGLRWVTNEETGTAGWQTINRNDPTLSVEDMKNFIKHQMLPELRKKLVGMVERTMTPNVSDSLKPDGVAALLNLADSLIRSYEIDQDPNSTVDAIGNSKVNIFERRDPNELKRKITVAREVINSGGKYSEMSESEIENKLRQLRSKLSEADPLTIKQTIDDYFNGINNIKTISDSILSLYQENSTLRGHYYEAKDLIENYLSMPHAQSVQESFDQNTREAEAARLGAFHDAITDFTDNIIFGN